jgi:hypothetical protein
MFSRFQSIILNTLTIESKNKILDFKFHFAFHHANLQGLHQKRPLSLLHNFFK